MVGSPTEWATVGEMYENAHGKTNLTVVTKGTARKTRR